MQGKQAFAIQTLVVALVLNGILLAVVFFVESAFATFGIGLLITLLLWFGVQTIGKRFIGGAPGAEAKAPSTKKTPAKKMETQHARKTGICYTDARRRARS